MHTQVSVRQRVRNLLGPEPAALMLCWQLGRTQLPAFGSLGSFLEGNLENLIYFASSGANLVSGEEEKRAFCWLDGWHFLTSSTLQNKVVSFISMIRRFRFWIPNDWPGVDPSHCPGEFPVQTSTGSTFFTPHLLGRAHCCCKSDDWAIREWDLLILKWPLIYCVVPASCFPSLGLSFFVYKTTELD